MIIINVLYVIKTGKRDEFMKVINESGICTETKRENGNLRYDYHYPVNSNNEILLIEYWKNKEVWDVHKLTIHVQKFQDLKKEYVLDMVPELFETKE